MQKNLKLSWACTVRLLLHTYAMVKLSHVLVTDTYFCPSLMFAPEKKASTIMVLLCHNI